MPAPLLSSRAASACARAASASMRTASAADRAASASAFARSAAACWARAACELCARRAAAAQPLLRSASASARAAAALWASSSAWRRRNASVSARSCASRSRACAARRCSAWNSSSCRCKPTRRASSAVCAAWRAGIMISLLRRRSSLARLGRGQQVRGLVKRLAGVPIGARQTRQLHGVPRLRQVQRRTGLERLQLQPGGILVHQVRAALEQLVLGLNRLSTLPSVPSRTTFSMTTTSLGCVTAK